MLTNEWTGGYGGVPPFDAVRIDEFEPALEWAMAQHLEEVERIAESAEAPTFENTLEALERAGRAVERVFSVFEVWSANVSTPEFREIEREMAPRLAAFADRVTQNEALFRRIEAVYEGAKANGLTPEQQRLAWQYWTRFVRAGARLEGAEKARLSAINQRLAALFTQFNQNVLADEDGQWLLLESEADLAGVPQTQVAAAAAAAEEKGFAGKWLIANTRSSMEPFLTYAARRDLRERGWRMWTERGLHPGEHDNMPLVREILVLRAERARLLGYDTHAHWRLEKAMARDPQRALDLLTTIWPKAAARVAQEVAEMQALAAAEGDDIRIEPWDYRYYAEKVRAANFALDQNRIKEYLQLDRVRDALFHLTGELFGLQFRRVEDVPVFHPDVQVWQVLDRDGAAAGLWYFDPFARQGKRSGAWMTAYRSQERFEDVITPLVSNNCNYMRGRSNEPVLLSWDDATTLFHEFGHALHGLLSAVQYPTLSGTNVPRDFVEFPSQLLEHWLSTPEVLQRFALHYRTGEPMPADLVERIRRAATFNQGFATMEYLASAIVDLHMHLADSVDDPAAFEQRVLEDAGLPREVVMRHRTPHFQHAFGSDGYSAAYYSYLWADTLVADAWEAFMEGDGAFDQDVAGRLHRHVLAAGNTGDPADAYRAFRGRDAATEALFRKRGFA